MAVTSVVGWFYRAGFECESVDSDARTRRLVFERRPETSAPANCQPGSATLVLTSDCLRENSSVISTFVPCHQICTITIALLLRQNVSLSRSGAALKMSI